MTRILLMFILLFTLSQSHVVWQEATFDVTNKKVILYGQEVQGTNPNTDPIMSEFTANTEFTIKIATASAATETVTFTGFPKRGTKSAKFSPGKIKKSQVELVNALNTGTISPKTDFNIFPHQLLPITDETSSFCMVGPQGSKVFREMRLIAAPYDEKIYFFILNAKRETSPTYPGFAKYVIDVAPHNGQLTDPQVQRQAWQKAKNDRAYFKATYNRQILDVAKTKVVGYEAHEITIKIKQGKELVQNVVAEWIADNNRHTADIGTKRWESISDRRRASTVGSLSDALGLLKKTPGSLPLSEADALWPIERKHSDVVQLEEVERGDDAYTSYYNWMDYDYYDRNDRMDNADSHLYVRDDIINYVTDPYNTLLNEIEVCLLGIIFIGLCMCVCLISFLCGLKVVNVGQAFIIHTNKKDGMDEI